MHAVHAPGQQNHLADTNYSLSVDRKNVAAPGSKQAEMCETMFMKEIFQYQKM